MTKVIGLFIYLVYFGLAHTSTVFAQNLADSSGVSQEKIVVRSVHPNDLLPFKQDRAFQYERPKPPEESLWEKLYRLATEWFNKVLGKSATTWIFRNGMYVGLFVIIGLIIWRIFVSEQMGLFTRKQHQSGVGINTIGDIHGIDFEPQIVQAVAQKHYREAVRLYYLRTLKQLEDCELIRWKPDKTNHDYVNELRQTPFSAQFSTLTRHFEYVWYGDLPLNTSDFEQIQAEFGAFSETLKTNAAL